MKTLQKIVREVDDFFTGRHTAKDFTHFISFGREVLPEKDSVREYRKYNKGILLKNMPDNFQVLQISSIVKSLQNLRGKHKYFSPIMTGMLGLAIISPFISDTDYYGATFMTAGVLLAKTGIYLCGKYESREMKKTESDFVKRLREEEKEDLEEWEKDTDYDF